MKIIHSQHEQYIEHENNSFSNSLLVNRILNANKRFCVIIESYVGLSSK